MCNLYISDLAANMNSLIDGLWPQRI